MIRKTVLSSALLLGLLTGPVQAGVEVLTSIKPLQLIAAAVQQGQGTPQVLLPAGASPHHYSLRPSDLRNLQQAQLFYWIGPDMEGFLHKPLQQRKGGSLAVQQLAGLQLRYFDGEPEEEDGHDAHDDHDGQGHAGHDDHDDHGHEGHDHRAGSLDGHLWLLPDNARLIATRMAADLAKADPANAAQYQANLKAFNKRLQLLDIYLKDRLKRVKRKPFFVAHEAFDYFEQAYGLKHRGVLALSDEVSPGARHLAELREQMQKAGAACVFHEPPQPSRLLVSVTKGLPLQLRELDPLGADLDVDERGYEALLSRLGNAMAGCLERL